MEEELKKIFIASALTSIHENGKMDDFLKFARKNAKENGMESEELTEFFDFLETLEKKKEYDDTIDWKQLIDIVTETTGCKLKCFVGDSSMIIENEKMYDVDSKINLEKINKALEPINVKLEFIESMNWLFDVDGFQNFCRFKVITID